VCCMPWGLLSQGLL